MSKNKQQIGLRRSRLNPIARKLVQEHSVHVSKLIQPLFVVEGIKGREKIAGLSDVYRDTSQTLLTQIESDLKSGVHSFLLFGVPSVKRSAGFKFDFAAKQIAQIKKTFGSDVFLAVDVCLCSYTHSGQCGVLNPEGDHLLNSETVEELAREAGVFAQAGADCVAPSDMMDGRIAAIRNELERKKLDRTLILSYSAKFHSRFYGPFRAAADSAPKAKFKLQDRASYQIDAPNYRDALASSLRDYEEGADWLMVKPGLPYLDVLYRLSQEIACPWAVYEVSGEYAAIEVLSKQGLVDGPRAHLESWKAFHRAGANMIITYGARQAKKWIEEFES